MNLLCQYPNSDNFHFYDKKEKRGGKKMNLCQYPNSDNFHFYLFCEHNLPEYMFGVNILIRITFISTGGNKNEKENEFGVSIS